MRIGEFEILDNCPKIERPIVIAMLRPWLDVGQVGTLSLNIIQKHLKTKEIGRIAEPGKFFDFTRYRPRMRTINRMRNFILPNTILHYGHDNTTNRNYLFIHIREPHMYGERYCKAISDLLSYFDVEEYCRIGAMYDSVPHTRSLIISGSVADQYKTKTEGLISQKKNNYQGPTSIVNMLPNILEHNNVQTSNLIAHLPQYIQLEEDYMGCAEIIKVLATMYNLPQNLIDRKRGLKQYEDVNNAVKQNEEVINLVVRLESYYDHVLTDSTMNPDEEINLPPDVEQFLREVTKNMDKIDNNDT